MGVQGYAHMLRLLLLRLGKLKIIMSNARDSLSLHGGGVGSYMLERLLRLQKPHVDVLLMRGSDLLLLLLEQFDLLL